MINEADRELVRAPLRATTQYWSPTAPTPWWRPPACWPDLQDKTIVLTGALNPARFRGSDAVFNIGCAVGSVQTLPPVSTSP